MVRPRQAAIGFSTPPPKPPGWDFGQWLNEQSEPTDDGFFAEIEGAQAEARAAGIPDCRG